MKEFAIIVKNIGIALICLFIASAINSHFQNISVEISIWTQRFIGVAIGFYIGGKTILELQTHKN